MHDPCTFGPRVFWQKLCNIDIRKGNFSFIYIYINFCLSSWPCVRRLRAAVSLHFNWPFFFFFCGTCCESKRINKFQLMWIQSNASWKRILLAINTLAGGGNLYSLFFLFSKIKEEREMNPLVERGNPCETWIFINSCRSNDSFRSERFEELGISNGNISVFLLSKTFFFLFYFEREKKGKKMRKEEKEKKEKKHTPVKFVFFMIVRNYFLVVIYCIHLSHCG